MDCCCDEANAPCMDCVCCVEAATRHRPPCVAAAIEEAIEGLT